MNYIEIVSNTLKSCVEFKETGKVPYDDKLQADKDFCNTPEFSSLVEDGTWLCEEDITALKTIPCSNGILQPKKICVVGYADEGCTSVIFLYGETENCGVEVGYVEDEYFLERFYSGMSKEDIQAELANMVINEFKKFDNIDISNVDIEYLKESITHPIRQIDEYLNDGQFEENSLI